MHPAEDWAETFAHYLHIRDTLDTAAAFGFAPSGASFERRMLGRSGFDTIIERWLPLAWALNMVNRSMGRDDLDPFVLPTVVLEKMRFIHTVIDEMASDPATLASAGGGNSPRRDGRARAPRTLDGRRSRRWRSSTSPGRATAHVAIAASPTGRG
jgi:hypothetical protein